jgi:excisionase family DNA binding protein
MTKKPEISGERVLLSVTEAARRLSVSVRFIRALAARGHLHMVRLGGRTLITPGELERLARDGAPEG